MSRRHRQLRPPKKISSEPEVVVSAYEASPVKSTTPTVPTTITKDKATSSDRQNIPPDRFQVIISSMFMLLLMVTPFLFTWFNDELFEFNKMVFVYGVTAIVLGVWVARMIWYKQILVKRTWFDIPILLFVASQVLSTLFSIHPRTSIFGYYSRFHGGLLSTACYVTLFYAALSNLDAKMIPRLLKGTFVSALVVTLLAIPEHFGHAITCLAINTSQNSHQTFGFAQLVNNFNASCWIQDVQSRVFATFGQPNWLAAYAIALIPVGVGLTITKRDRAEQLLYGLTSVLLFATLIFTKSRSGVLGLAAGLGLLILGAAGLWWRSRQGEPKPQRPIIDWDWGLAALGVIGFAAVVIFFGTPFTPSIQDLTKTQTPAATSDKPAAVVDRLEAGGTDSGEIRKIVWEGAIRVWKRYPLFGSGVETFAYSYYQDRPVEHNLVSEWDFLYNKAHNEFLNFLATTGAVGLITYCVLLAALLGIPLYLAWQAATAKNVDAALIAIGTTAGLVALTISNFFGFSTVMVTVLLFLLPALIWIWAQPNWNSEQHWSDTRNSAQWIALGATAVLSLALLASVGKGWLADYFYYQAKQALRAGQVLEGVPKMEQAISLTPGEATFYDEAANDYSQLAVSLIQSNQATAGATLAGNAVKVTQKLTELNPVNVNFYKTQARVFLTLSQVEPSFMEPALQSLKIARDLAPTDAKVLYNLALVELSMGKGSDGLADLEKTVQIKSNYESARQTLAQQYEAAGKIEAAKDQYTYILEEIQPNNEIAKQRLAAFASTSAQKKR